ncbi:G-patch domain-containing protein [Cynara cardunculus var. scolymus]|uniref:G-patch domain-containing protein n=1 Tax=Cynara cardunculus var. scolymus TaxID=59895 RepID=A0A103XSB4_CYNCS|nr:G-patch domain-containing protein [Cynara cardunculus var. scolymus]
MERFKQLQQEKGKGDKVEASRMDPTLSVPGKPNPVISSSGSVSRASDSRKMNPAPSSGKLTFSLKQKSKLVAPAVKLSEDEDEDEKNAGKASGGGPIKRQKLDQPDAYDRSLKQLIHNTSVNIGGKGCSVTDLESVAACYRNNLDSLVHALDLIAPPCPSDPTIKKVAEKLASFVAKNGRQFEHITRQKNPGDTPFKFLFDESSADYKYYEYRLIEEEKALVQSVDSQLPHTGAAKPATTSGSQRSDQQSSNYQIPASALYEATDSAQSDFGESTASSASDPIAMMEFYMKKAAQEEKKRQPKQGHHMGDYIPQEELEKFMASCNDVAAQKAAKEAAERARIQADNVGHRLLSKMGWKEGEGLGSSRSGIADPITEGNVKKDHLGVGASNPGEVTPDDDIYEQYKKRMMLGYRHRPNPLVRKSPEGILLKGKASTAFQEVVPKHKGSGIL